MSGPSSASDPGMKSLNWKEIDLVLSELSLPGSLIQEIHQPAHDRIVLNLFRGGSAFSVLVSLSSRFPRMHLLTERMVNPEKPLRFASFLRAHIRGGRIQDAVQLRAGGAGTTAGAAAGGGAGAAAPAPQAPGERIVRLSIMHAGEEKVLWVRLWGAAANAILTDSEGMILDAFYRRPKKGEISGKPFAALGAPARATESGPAARGSRPAAAAGEATPPAPRKEFAVREIPGEGTFNEKIERLFSSWETRGDTERLAALADSELEMSENKLLANMEKLQGRLKEYANLQRFKELGDLVTSSLHTLRKGDRWLDAVDFYHDDALVRIELAPELTPAGNAESYYERHRKARLGRSKVEHEIGQLTRTLEKVRRQRESIGTNPDPAALGKVAAGAARARAPLFDAGTPGLVFSSPPFRIIVGRTATENDTLLRKKVRGNDWWFHARDWPGAYVFVKAQAGKSLPLETMLDAATLAVHFSRGKTSGQGDVYYTQVKYLRRAKGAKKGTVLPTQEKNLHIKLDPERIERLKAGEE